VKFTVEHDVLGEAVSWVARALPTRPVVPVLSGMLVQAEADTLTLSCFDYEVSARVVMPAEVGEPGSALVPGRLLAEITRSLPPDQVDVSAEGGTVMLTCGSAEFSLVSLAQDDYPRVPALPVVAGTADGGALATAAAQVVPSASRDDTLAMLTAVCLDINGYQITLAATDRYRMAVATIDWQPAEPSMRATALVPARTLADIARTMGPGVPVTIAFSQPADGHDLPGDGMISFEGSGRRLTARLLGGDYIKYESRFPAEYGCGAELPAGSFTEAVRRVSLVADRISPLRLTFRSDTVVVEAHSDGRARAVESVPVRFTGPQQAISFNPHYLLDGLAAAALSAARCGQPGCIRLDFTSPAKPALITWAPAAQPDAGESVEDRNGLASAGSPADTRGRVEDHPFRYLVVPLRPPAG
jgi:DNA polymerase III subunit beta